MINITFGLTESYMQLFEVHIDIACFHRIQVPINHGYHIQRKLKVILNNNM